MTRLQECSNLHVEGATVRCNRRRPVMMIDSVSLYRRAPIHLDLSCRGSACQGVVLHGVCYLPMLASQNSAMSTYFGNQMLPRLRTWARKSSRSCAMPTVPLTWGWMA